MSTRIITVIIRLTRPGSTTAIYWSMLMACISAIDSIMLPLSIVTDEFMHSEDTWRTQYSHADVEHAIMKHRSWSNFEIWLDAFFIADLIFRAAQAAVLDMGIADSSSERIVDALTTVSKHTVDKPVEIMDDVYDKGFQFGNELRRQLFCSIPLRLLLMLPVWIEAIRPIGPIFAALARFARAYRILDVMKYFSSRQEDVATDVRWVAFFKFSYIIYLTVRLSICVIQFAVMDDRCPGHWVNGDATYIPTDGNWMPATRRDTGLDAYTMD